MKRQYPFVLLAAFAGILIGSLFLTGSFPGSLGRINEPDPVDHPSATSMPLDVKYAFSQREKAFDAIGTYYLQVDENYIDEEIHCEGCIYAEYRPGPHGRAVYAFESLKTIDLSDARFVNFIGRGDAGGEVINVYIAGRKVPVSANADPDERGLAGVEFAFEKQIVMQNDWSKYEVDLSGIDLSKVTHPFAFEIISGSDNQTQLVYLDFVYYDAEKSEYSIPLN